jgi:hypothetical protein
MRVLGLIGAFVVAVLVSQAAGASASTYFVLEKLEAMGAPTSWAERLYWMGHDILGMWFWSEFPYGVVIAVGLFIAFSVAWFIAKAVSTLAWLVFMLAGAAALIVSNETVTALVGVTPIAGAREFIGLLMQGGAGAIGGLFFSLLRPRD